jgi:TonB family protein
MERKQPVLASDEEGGTLDLRFSLASEIVELVVFTADEAFLQTLREAVGGARRLWHVPSADKVSDLLIAGEVGILVLDVLALNEAATIFIAQIKRQFPDLVILVAGNRDAEISLTGLISAGTVYRFIHKPMSPGRAKLFADAAVKKYDAQRSRTASTTSLARRPRSHRGPLIGGAVGLLALTLVVAWAVRRGAENKADAPPVATPVASPPVASPPGASTIESPLLVQPGAALAANPLTEPAGDNALTAQLAKSRERTLAAQAAAHLREVKPEADKLTQETQKEAAASAHIDGAEAAARRQADRDARARLLKSGEERLQQDRLIEPAGDSAKYYLLALGALDPNSPGLGAAMQELGSRLVAKARLALTLEQYDAARTWLDEASSLGVASVEWNAARHDLDTAVSRQQFLTTVAAASDLKPIKSIKPEYPKKAELAKVEGWVELDFTVAESGQVTDVAVHAASAPGVFESAAISALSQWRYKPMVRDGKPVAQRARIRMRFAL